MKLNGIHQLLAHADNINLMGSNINTIYKNKETLIDAGKVVEIGANVGKNMFMSLSPHQNAGQNWNIKIENNHLKMYHYSNIWE
jgi:hypothetical protein